MEYHAFGRAHDLMGFADIFAYKDGRIAFVQVTSLTNVAARRSKVEANEHATALAPYYDVLVLGFKPKETVPRHAKQWTGNEWVDWEGL